MNTIPEHWDHNNWQTIYFHEQHLAFLVYTTRDGPLVYHVSIVVFLVCFLVSPAVGFS